LIPGSLKKNIQKNAKITNTDPRTRQAITAGSIGIKNETAISIAPAIKDGKIKGNPSLRIDIFTFL
jgi:hypothetical protein